MTRNNDNTYKNDKQSNLIVTINESYSQFVNRSLFYSTTEKVDTGDDDAGDDASEEEGIQTTLSPLEEFTKCQIKYRFCIEPQQNVSKTIECGDNTKNHDVAPGEKNRMGKTMYCNGWSQPHTMNIK